MSAEAPTPKPGMPRRRRLRVIKSNRSQILLFSILTLILTAATVWAGRTWLQNSETLVFAVGEANGPEARFAARLATVLKNNSSRLQLKIVPNGDNAKALAQFDRKEANLAILRTDAKIPPRARAVAILEHDVVLLISPGGKKIKTVAELKKKKIAVLADNESSVTLIRNILELSDTPAAARGSRWRRRVSTLDKLFASGFGAVIAIAHASRTVKDKSYEQYCQARRLHPERDRRGEGADPEISGPFRRNDRGRHAVGLAGDPRRRYRDGRAAMAAGRAVQAVDADRERSRAHHLREQGRTRARRRLRLQDRAGRDRQGCLHRRASGRRRIHQ